MASNHGGASPQRRQVARDAGAPDFTEEEIKGRALETARRVLATPKKPAGPKVPGRPPVVTGGKKPRR